MALFLWFPGGVNPPCDPEDTCLLQLWGPVGRPPWEGIPQPGETWPASPSMGHQGLCSVGNRGAKGCSEVSGSSRVAGAQGEILRRLETLGFLPKASSRTDQWPEKSTQDESPACSGRLRVGHPWARVSLQAAPRALARGPGVAVHHQQGCLWALWVTGHQSVYENISI